MAPAAVPAAAETMMWQTLIHLAFILSAIALAWIDKSSLTPAERATHARTAASQHTEPAPEPSRS